MSPASSTPSAPTIGRTLTFVATMAVLVAELILGPVHPLSASGLVALMAAAAFYILHPNHPLAGSVAFGPLLALLAWQLQWHLLLAAIAPALFQMLLAFLVARTLRTGQVPAIERIGQAMQPDGEPLHPDMQRYSRHSTWAWLLIFLVLGLLNLSSVLLDVPHFEWPMIMGLYDVLLCGCAILLEYFYRRWRYAAHNKHTLTEFCQELLQINPLKMLLSR